MTEIIECPACSARQVQAVNEWRLSGKRARAFSCLDCGLLFAHPQPAQEELNAYYAPDGGWQASRVEKSPKSPQTRTKGAAPALMAALDRYFPASKPPVGSRVFDFGCGTGTWLNSFQDHGWETVGLEPSSDAAFERHQRLHAIPSEPQFDLVLAYHVLEHLPRPLHTMKALAQAIRPGGHFLVSVPRIDTLAVHRQVDYCLHPRHHIVGFTEACLRGLLTRAGLGVVAALHDLDDRFSKGEPVRLRLLARNGATPVAEPDPAAALKPVIEAFVALRQSA
jgi:2-polyprenyl-3-methyl-5-hydroxy-6-metoxy-1,4-benzoquinol methylase